MLSLHAKMGRLLRPLVQLRGATSRYRLTTQSVSPLAPLGVEAATQTDPTSSPEVKIFKEFDLSGRAGIVSGGNRGLGLEMALALCEAGARIYCLDLPKTPSDVWAKTRDHVERLGNGSALHYLSVDVRNQTDVWKCGEHVGDKEGTMDMAVAAAGILQPAQSCLDYRAQDFEEVMDVNVNGVLYTAQAAGRQMRRFNKPGSLILIASMSGSITNKNQSWVPYNASKSAVLQMARSMACELGKHQIRVNSLSPGHIYTSMTAGFLDTQPQLLDEWSSMNPLGRLGRPDELRGVCTWLASDASSFTTGSDILVTGGHHAW
ncbi:hypothetical protein DL96DRAFT_450432 [Flagelloscypha sp. PMI_526]|nr:hypothetical protein DL96DRAFT_450432 [Flagelloscypha sp. PMI_526]